MTKTHAGFLISQIRNLSGRAFERILRESGVDAFNGPQGRILYVLWEHEDLTISDIARLTSLASTTLTSMLDRMEGAGLIWRSENPKNRRETIVTATEKAEALRGAYDAVSERANEIFYAGFTDEEIMAFENTLRRILHNFERMG